jgi:hypothetical protein
MFLDASKPQSYGNTKEARATGIRIATAPLTLTTIISTQHPD